jgi:2-iminobutanoate/2-iminopropanoate deaminase
MPKRRVRSGSVPEPGPQTFSQCLVVGETIYVSGQHAGNDDGSISGAGMEGQARTAFERIESLLMAAGASMDDIVKLTVYVTEISRRAELSAARRAFFSGDFPCSTLVEVSALAAPELLVEIEAIAISGSGDAGASPGSSDVPRAE